MRQANNYYNINQELEVSSNFIDGAKTAIPIVIGFIPVATAFGMVAMNAGLNLYQCVFMSFMVFGGASQLMAVSMLASGAGILQIVIATFAINFRHFVMGMSVIPKLQHIATKWNILLFFGLTDETFAILSLNKNEKINKYYVAGLNFTSFLAWVLGTLLGSLFGIKYWLCNWRSNFSISYYAKLYEVNNRDCSYE